MKSKDLILNGSYDSFKVDVNLSAQYQCGRTAWSGGMAHGGTKGSRSWIFRVVSGGGPAADGSRRVGGSQAVAAAALAATALAGAGSALAAGRPGTGVRRVAPDAAATVSTPPPNDGYQFVEVGSRKDKTLQPALRRQ